MRPCLVLLFTAQLMAVGAKNIIQSHIEAHERSSDLMRMLSVVDVSDRNLQTWWDEFSESWAEYSLMVKKDPTLYCFKPEMLLKQLNELEDKVKLVFKGLEAKEEQLRQIRALLEHVELGGKSGLHCQQTPEEPICKALDILDKQAAQERIRLNSELKLVTDEIKKVKNHPCDCTYNDWVGDWGECSVTCDDGSQTETRGIKWKKRNGGKDCVPAEAERTQICNDGCCPKDCVWEGWSEWTACPEVLAPQPQYQRAFRSVQVEHECAERGGKPCVGETKKERTCNILEVKNEEIAEKEKEIESLEEEIKGLKEGCHINNNNNNNNNNKGQPQPQTQPQVNPAPQASQLTARSLGCYEDRDSRMLTGKENKSLNNNSPSECQKFCRGFRYFAVQYTTECFCGNNLNHSVRKPDGECNASCPGNRSQKCGGTWRLNLYEN